MKLIDGMIIEQLGEEYVAVATGEASKAFNGMLRGNKTFAFLMQELQEEKDRAALVEALLNKYEVEQAVAKQEVDAFLKKIETAGLLV